MYYPTISLFLIILSIPSLSLGSDCRSLDIRVNVYSLFFVTDAKYCAGKMVHMLCLQEVGRG